MTKNWIISLITLLLASACKTTQPARPQEYYENDTFETPLSTLNLPVRIYKFELEQSINRQLGDVLYDDNNLADDGMMLKATRQQKVSLDIDREKISYRVPIKLWVKKDLAFTDVEADGSLALNFTTRYFIKPDWSLETVTEVSSYEWLQKPVVKLGFADLPITSIANIVLNQSKKTLSQSIDEEVKGLFDLKKEIQAAWKELHEPVLLSEEYKTWLLLYPQSIGMTPLQTKNGLVESIIVVTSKPRIFLGEKPVKSNLTNLSPFQFASTQGDDFTLLLDAEIPFSEAERLSKQNMVGETYSYGKKSVKVEDIELFGQGSRLVVNTKLSGSYNGNVYFTGKPVYNAKRNKIELEDADFDFSTRRTLLKTASWLFKGSLVKQVQENIDFYLRENLDETRNMIQEELKNYALAPGINLNGSLAELNVSHVYIAADAIKVRIGLKGKVNVEVKGLE
jgi:hypothetical protein